MTEWKSALQKAREDRQTATDENSARVEGLKSKLLFRFPALSDQLLTYRNAIAAVRRDDERSLKQIIVETRAALRFGLCCASFESDAARSLFQDHAVMKCNLHAPLASILSLQGGDSKCRTLSAQLLSNLVTGNRSTSQHLASSLPISPSCESISEKILQETFSKEHLGNISEHIEGKSWVDFLLFAIKSGNREAAGAVAAALHNCIISLDKRNDESWSFVKRVASDPILISTILRNIVPAKAPLSDEEQDHWDGATEWFYLLLTRLMNLGMMSFMYAGISRSPLCEIHSVLPEQNVLLHCMVKQIEESKEPTDMVGSAEEETYTFLAGLFRRLLELKSKGGMADDDTALLDSAISSVLEILATVLAADSIQTTTLREHLGAFTRILQDCSSELGLLVDDLSERTVGVKTREMKIPQEKQNLMTLLVRVLANLSFRCEQNQDLMRTTWIPRKDPSENVDSSPRSALHVLLSCTAFSAACFTLREWCVIGIRNILENNVENQNVVATLDAQSPVQTAALSEAGLQVQMDSKGKVSLSTLKE
eukprot:scaffold1900_cov123-Cylindrotheca_fusiformis.AAC.42